MKILRIKIVFFILTLLFCSCSYKNIVGVYEYKYYNVTTQLRLCENNKFQLTQMITPSNFILEGKWEINKAELLLSAYKSGYFEINECDTCRKSIINVFDKQSNIPLEHALIQLYKNENLIETIITNENGIALFDVAVDSIIVKFIGFESVNFIYCDTISSIDVYLDYGNDYESIPKYIHKGNAIFIIDNGVKYKLRKQK